MDTFNSGYRRVDVGILGSDRDDVFGDGVGGGKTIITTTQKKHERLKSPDTDRESAITPQSNYIVKFKQRVFSFPDTPPATPIKTVLEGNFTDLTLRTPKNTSPNDERTLSRYKLGLVSPKHATKDRALALGISGLEEEQQSAVSVPTTPELTQNPTFANYGAKLPPSPPKTPCHVASFQNGRNLVTNEIVDDVVDVTKLSENEESGGSTPPYFEFPPTPPLTPTRERKASILENKAIVSFQDLTLEDSAPLLDLTTPLPASHAHFDPLTTALLISLLHPKASCSGCTTIPIDITLFSAISSALSSNFQPTKHPSHPSLQIHPALIENIIAIVPTSSTNPQTQTKFFAALIKPICSFSNTSHTPSIFQEVDFATLRKYQALRREEFQISCATKCSKHTQGHQIWKFAYAQTMHVGRGTTEGIPPRAIAAWKRKVLERKLGYYAR